MEIIEGIHRIDEASGNIAHSNVYLVINDSELAIVDTGTPGNAKKIIAYIQQLQHQPSEVSTIILTHYHMDHAGSVKELQELTNAKVAAGAGDAAVIEGKQPYPKPKNIFMRAATSIVKIAPVTLDMRLEEGDRICNLTIIGTPGHTPGSVMLFDTRRRALFAGDTLRLDGDKVTAGPKNCVWDEEKEIDSIKKVAALQFDVLLPGHGEFLKGNASSAVKAFADSLK